ncbi:hypothetical protein COO60DRAFT_675446 [Scenedesmus sp. NREL 46B-D3]|nr:hypothetical protein COO60DRAFT_675446 [Scenedesmus sp. NREL 46B-D3]
MRNVVLAAACPLCRRCAWMHCNRCLMHRLAAADTQHLQRLWQHGGSTVLLCNSLRKAQPLQLTACTALTHAGIGVVATGWWSTSSWLACVAQRTGVRVYIAACWVGRISSATGSEPPWRGTGVVCYRLLQQRCKPWPLLCGESFIGCHDDHFGRSRLMREGVTCRLFAVSDGFC